MALTFNSSLEPNKNSHCELEKDFFKLESKMAVFVCIQFIIVSKFWCNVQLLLTLIRRGNSLFCLGFCDQFQEFNFCVRKTFWKRFIHANTLRKLCDVIDLILADKVIHTEDSTVFVILENKLSVDQIWNYISFFFQ
jgi:hypothetical protein